MAHIIFAALLSCAGRRLWSWFAPSRMISPRWASKRLGISQACLRRTDKISHCTDLTDHTRVEHIIFITAVKMTGFFTVSFHAPFSYQENCVSLIPSNVSRKRACKCKTGDRLLLITTFLLYRYIERLNDLQYTTDDDDLEGPDSSLGEDSGWKQVRFRLPLNKNNRV